MAHTFEYESADGREYIVIDLDKADYIYKKDGLIVIQFVSHQITFNYDEEFYNALLKAWKER